MNESVIVPEADPYVRLVVSREKNDRVYIEVNSLSYSGDTIVELSRPEARQLVKALRWAIDGKVKP